MIAYDPSLLNEKLVIDSAGNSVGYVTDVLGAWLEMPSYIEVTMTYTFFSRLKGVGPVTCILYPISRIALVKGVVQLDRPKKELISEREFTPAQVMENEGYQIASVRR